MLGKISMKKIIALVLGTLSGIGIGNTSEYKYAIGDMFNVYSSFEENKIRRASYHTGFLDRELNEGVYENFQNKQGVNWGINSCEYLDTRKYPNISLTEPVEKREVKNCCNRNSRCLQFDTAYLIPAIIVATQVDDEESAIRCYNDATSQKSVHFLIRLNGEIIECVPLSKRAWGGFDISTVNDRKFEEMMDIYFTTKGSPADVCGIYIGLIRGNEFKKQEGVCSNLIQILQAIYEIPNNYIFIPSEYIAKTSNLNSYASYSKILNELCLLSEEENEDSDSSSSTELVTPSDTEDSPLSIERKGSPIQQENFFVSDSDENLE